MPMRFDKTCLRLRYYFIIVRQPPRRFPWRQCRDQPPFPPRQPRFVARVWTRERRLVMRQSRVPSCVRLAMGFFLGLNL
jgi:hypothetical protein